MSLLSNTLNNVVDTFKDKTKEISTAIKNKINDKLNTETPEEPVNSSNSVALQISSDNINEDGRDDSAILIETIQNTKLELLKELYEILGEDFGDDKAKIEIRNYSIENPISIGTGVPGGPDGYEFGQFVPPVGGTTDDVRLTVIRGQRFTNGGRNAAYGKLYVNGQYWFDTGERSLVNPGTYRVAFRKETGCTRTSRKDWMAAAERGDKMHKFAGYSDGYVPLVLNVPGRSGIRIHQGTSVGWSEGCLITGIYNNGKLDNSWECWKKLYDYCYNARSVTITYQG